MKLFLVAAALLLAALAQAQGPPRGDELKYVVILTRHGVRSPTWTPERLAEYSTAPWPDWGVPPGNLTPHGRKLMSLLGAYYRERLAAEGLLAGLSGKADCEDAKRIYIWADTDQRTLETARALSEELAPGCGAAIHSRPPGEDDPLFDPIMAGLVKQDPEHGRAAVAARIGPKLDALVEHNRPALELLNAVLNGPGPDKARRSVLDQPVSLAAGPDGAAMTGPLAIASTLTEDFLLEYANGMSGNAFGWGRMTVDQLQQVLALHTAYADLMRRTQYIAQVRGSNLLDHILKSLDQARTGTAVKGALGEPAAKLLVLSGHDTNLSNLSGMLDLTWQLPGYQRDDAPPGGAVLFSLWRSRLTWKYSVELQFLSQTLAQMHDAAPLSLARPPAMTDVSLPGCGKAGVRGSCDWNSFAKIVTAAIGPGFVDSAP